MEEKTLFTLRAPEIGEAADETQTVVSDGGELLIKIRSRKQKIVNGKVVETTTPSCKVTMSIPVTVNLSSYGDRTTADTGDRVTVWTSSGSTFSQIGSFTVPSAGGTVSI